MKSDNERIEAFLKGIVLPEYTSDGHARQLRTQILSRLQATCAGSGPSSWWKTAALLLGLLGAAAVATETIIQVRHYHLEGRTKNGFYYFSTTPENAGTNQVDSIGVFVRGDLDAAGIEQKRKDLEEIDALRQRNARELVGVADHEVKGNPPHRTFIFNYVLADGRTVGNAEGELEGDQQQILSLRQRGQSEILQVIEDEFGGQRIRRFTRRYVLSDGRAVSVPETDPEQPGPLPLTTEQQMELALLGWGDHEKGKFLGSAPVQMLGRTVTLQKYSFTLSDGTVVTRSEAQLDASKRDLSAAQLYEVNRLAAAHKGETLASYDENVMGKPFKFTRVKYVLSDGTEAIQSTGKPDGER
jgi:hypothetical protein